MSELVEKQVVIDWLKYKWNRNADSLFYGIQGLPSAQPKYTELSPEDVALELSPEDMNGALAWYSTIMKLIQTGHVICRKENR